MSVFITTQYPNALQILSDGAVVKSDGTLVAVEEKIYYSRKLPIAITGRGAHEKIKTTAMGMLRFDMFGSVDKVLEYLAEIARKAAERSKTEKVSAVDAFELVICAYSETVGPVRFYFSTHSYTSVPPMTLQMLDDTIFVGGPPVSGEELSALDITMKTAEDEGTNFLPKFGVDIFELMRRKKGGNPIRPDMPEAYGLGGQCQLTTVTSEGVKVETLKVWPDKIGEKIDPFRVKASRELEAA